ncbi:MAG: filamentous hemagglutinin, partial [Pleurocapsa sp.]
EARSSTPANDTNDIDASSQFGLDGDVAINTPDVDPTRGLDNLPSNIVDASRLITRNCLNTGDDRLNEFIITGRGGLPNYPNDLLSGDATISADWVSLPEADINNAPAKTTTEVTTEHLLVEAKGWKMKPDGTVVLIAENSTPELIIPWMGSHSCSI